MLSETVFGPSPKNGQILRAALKGTNLRGQTPICGFLRKTCGFLQKFRKGVGVEGVGVANCHRIIF